MAAVATEAALAGGILVEGILVALVGGISAGTLAALATPAWLAPPYSTAIILSAIDLPSGTGTDFSIIDLPSGTGTDFSIIGSSGIGLPFSARASLTGTTMAATRAYGRRGDGAGGTSATERERKSITYQTGPPARGAGEFFRPHRDPFANWLHNAGLFPISADAAHHGGKHGEQKRHCHDNAT